MKEQQLLRDSSIEPTNEIIAEGLGAANNTYVKFIEELKNRDIEVNWRYYNDGKAWLGKALYKWTTVRGTQKEVTVLWLSIWDGFFKVSLFIPEKARTEVLTLPLDENIKEMIENSKQMGKLKFFPLVFDLCSDELLNDIYTIVDFKKTHQAR
ncbi:MAG: DUF3788 domain-containing protein [Methanomicrobiales archaeon]|nr:DUF3788 domain-containing protein [Methanomicrobiales archaeon]